MHITHCNLSPEKMLKGYIQDTAYLNFGWKMDCNDKIFLIFLSPTQQITDSIMKYPPSCLLGFPRFTKCNEPFLSYLFIVY